MFSRLATFSIGIQVTLLFSLFDRTRRSVVPEGGWGVAGTVGGRPPQIPATILPQPAGRLLSEMLVEKPGNLAERARSLGQAVVEQVLRVRLAFVHRVPRLHSGRA